MFSIFYSGVKQQTWKFKGHTICFTTKCTFYCWYATGLAQRHRCGDLCLLSVDTTGDLRFHNCETVMYTIKLLLQFMKLILLFEFILTLTNFYSMSWCSALSSFITSSVTVFPQHYMFKTFLIITYLTLLPLFLPWEDIERGT